MAEIIRKILPMANGEKSTILIGQIKATTPKTRVAVIITEPITSPTIIQSWDFLAACKVKESSGKAVPKPTTKIPIKLKGKCKNPEKKTADLTIP